MAGGGQVDAADQQLPGGLLPGVAGSSAKLCPSGISKGWRRVCQPCADRTQVLCPPGEVSLWGWPWREGRVIRDRRLWKGAGLGTVSCRWPLPLTPHAGSCVTLRPLLRHIRTSRQRPRAGYPPRVGVTALLASSAPPCAGHREGGLGHLGGLRRTALPCREGRGVPSCGYAALSLSIHGRGEHLPSSLLGPVAGLLIKLTYDINGRKVNLTLYLREFQRLKTVRSDQRAVFLRAQ